MKSKRFDWSILARVFFLFITLMGLSLLILEGPRIFLLLIVPIVILQLVNFYQFHIKAQQEVEQFVESIHYRDFSRYFSVRHAPLELRSLRQGFNEINTTFKVISREKETQYQYLQKILELVDTGIISYETEEGVIAWMNDSFKKMLCIPYLKNIHSLKKRDENLYEQVLSLKSGEGRIVPITRDKVPFKAFLTATLFQTDGQVYKLIAFQNVDEALDETESQAWQKLLSVMTHEIMNSVAPISSLAETLKKRLLEGTATGGGNLDDLELGINTIQRRSEGLLKFAETYRNLNKIAKPRLTTVLVRDLFEHLHQLMQPTLEQKNIEMEIVLKDPSQILQIDTNLMEQVLINLIINAMDAVKDRTQPRIILSAGYGPSNKPIIGVADNGTGMSMEVLDKIFIPFFSTKKSGSGIGLSLCKQIMLLHHGNIQAHTIEGEGSSFKLQF
ncbi:MAG TPA: HAMP domain-containing sensor histidine kinase [Chitinophagaceae bacterium]|nr:HAMP domain-containing sensor histidine kinase [Chitinophagaceae bacterium]